MRVHLIAIGGAVMHNLAIALHEQGHLVSGSDDEIYDPARSRLAARDLLPGEAGWFPDKIHTGLDVVILGMHARADNPELQQALALGLPVYSYPAFVYEHARQKTRCVVAGSHGKTTTTAMVMHCLRKLGRDFDYLVGAQLEGFDTMVRLSDAPVLVAEGDEYLASPLDPAAKMVRYRPHHAVVTGIAWDHYNVFPTYEDYCRQFSDLLHAIEPGGSLIWCAEDADLARLVEAHPARSNWKSLPYRAFDFQVRAGRMELVRPGKTAVPLQIFGRHNLMNAKAAALLCAALDVPEDAFVECLADFKGAAKRLQRLMETDRSAAWLDFAHAPSKVRATVEAVKALHPDRPLVACLELHTFSSLNREFLPQYDGALQTADQAVVFFSPHTLAMKKLPPLDGEDIRRAFNRPDLIVCTEAAELEQALAALCRPGCNLLFMSSGTLGGLDIRGVAQKLLTD